MNQKSKESASQLQENCFWTTSSWSLKLHSRWIALSAFASQNKAKKSFIYLSSKITSASAFQLYRENALIILIQKSPIYNRYGVYFSYPFLFFKKIRTKEKNKVTCDLITIRNRSCQQKHGWSLNSLKSGLKKQLIRLLTHVITNKLIVYIAWMSFLREFGRRVNRAAHAITTRWLYFMYSVSW